MNSRYDEQLYCVAEDTFAALAFMMPTDEETPEETPPHDDLVASVAFAGPFRGILFLSVSTDLLGELAANMLGLEGPEEPPIDKRLDAFAEALNVICGNLLPVIAGTEVVFDVHAPEIQADSRIPAEVEQHEPAGAARLTLDAGMAELALFIDDQPAAVTDSAA